MSAEFIVAQKEKRNGRLILVTAINPTPAGEGKTTTTVGLGDGLNRIGKKTIVCIREASLGPCFGIKGGAAGGGYAQVVPMSRRYVGDEMLLPKLPAGREWTPVRHGESGDRVYRRSDGGAYAKIADGKSVALLEGERDRVAWLAPFRLGSPSVCEWIAAETEA